MPRFLDRRASRLRAAVPAAAGLALLVPAGAQVHGLVGRADLPIPAWLFAWVAAGVLVLSYSRLGRVWATPRLEGVEARRTAAAFTLPRGWDAVWGAAGVALLALLVGSGLGGVQDATNMAPRLVLVFFWVGIPVVSVLAGDVWAALSPWRAAARAARALSPARAMPPALRLSAWLGRWPAVAGVVGFAWLELAYPGRDRPALLAVLALGYAGTQLVAIAAFGVEAWMRRGDAFAVLLNLFSRLSPWEREGRRVGLRRPLAGLADLSPAPGTVALLCAMIGSTAFDGLTNGGLWRKLSRPFETGLVNAGLGGTAILELVRTLGLLVTILLVGGLYRVGIRGMRVVSPGTSATTLSTRFVTSLAPIAFGYPLAHYFSRALPALGGGHVRRALAGGIAALALVLAGCGAGGGQTDVATIAGPKSPYRLGSQFPAGFLGRPAARIHLPDAHGGTFDTAALRGHPYVVTFLYTRCPDTCPLIGIELKSALSELGARARGLKVVAVSVDPAHDTPRAVRRWLRAHGEPPAFHFLTGPKATLRPVWKAWHVAPQIPGDPRSAHTAIIWLVDAKGRLVAGIDAGTALPTDDLVHDLRTLVASS